MGHTTVITYVIIIVIIIIIIIITMIFYYASLATYLPLNGQTSSRMSAEVHHWFC